MPPPPSPPSPPPDAAATLRLVGVAAVLSVLRAPAVFFHGRFWAEEGVVYFRAALEAPSAWAALLAPHLGYLSLVPNVATVLATRVPLEAAPLVTAWAALGVQLACLAVVVRAGLWRTPRQRVLAAAVVLLTAPSTEAWANTINSQFHLALAAGVLLADPGVRLRSAVPVLLVAGLTGPVSTFLAPLFALRAGLERSWPRAVQAGLLGACAALQAVLTLTAVQGGRRTLLLDLPLVCALVTRHLVAPWVGPQVAVRAGQWLVAQPVLLAVLVAAVGLPVLGVLGACARRLRGQGGRWLLAAALALVVPSLAGALIASSRWELVWPDASPRYSYAPNVLLGLFLVAALGAEGREGAGRRAPALLLGCLLLTGAVDFAASVRRFRGPRWSEEVQAWRQDPSRQVGVWPGGWSLPLPPAAGP